MLNRRLSILSLFVVFGFLCKSSVAGILYVGADVEDFAGGLPAGSGMDRLGVVSTNGASVNSSNIIVTDFLLNGMADADGKLLTGTPQNNTLNTVSFDGILLNSIAASGIPNNACCNEEMLFVPQAGGGQKLYHANWSPSLDGNAGIREIDPLTGVQLNYFAMTDVVGMALINDEIWISRWSAKEIGIWDPNTNTFNVQFDLDDLGLTGLGNAGALAYDPFEEVLWLGSQGGRITPFDLSGNQLGDSYLPFGAMNQTIDGLTFLGEVSKVPEPASLALLSLGVICLGFSRRGA